MAPLKVSVGEFDVVSIDSLPSERPYRTCVMRLCSTWMSVGFSDGKEEIEAIAAPELSGVAASRMRKPQLAKDMYMTAVT